MSKPKSKHNVWICIAWRRDSIGDTVRKRVCFYEPKSKAEALAAFKRKFPGLCDYTVQVG